MKALRWSMPFGIFVVLVAFLWIGLSHDPREIPSPLIDKPAPQFRLAKLETPSESLGTSDLKGTVWMLNVWASWCVSCRVEHPLLVQLAQQKLVPVYGLDYKDKPDDGRAWLAQHGNPYAASIIDADGRIGIDYGVYGVPETFVIDKKGFVRYKQIGPLTPEALQSKILPLVRELQR